MKSLIEKFKEFGRYDLMGGRMGGYIVGRQMGGLGWMDGWVDWDGWMDNWLLIQFIMIIFLICNILFKSLCFLVIKEEGWV